MSAAVYYVDWWDIDDPVIRHWQGRRHPPEDLKTFLECKREVVAFWTRRRDYAQSKLDQAEAVRLETLTTAGIRKEL